MEAAEPHGLLAAIDMGTNSFKLLLVKAQSESSTRFVPIDWLSSPVILGRCRSPDGSLSPSSIDRSLAALRSFSLFLSSRRVSRLRVVATSAVRSAPNRDHLLTLARSRLGLDIHVISGDEEARLVYLGVLHFLPVFHKRVLAVDIGGGSTEFVLGLKGDVFFSASLDLGHVTLTESFVKDKSFAGLRRHVRTVLKESGLIEKVKSFGFEIAVGSSGTVKSIEKAISGSDFGRKWRFDRDELESIVVKIVNFERLGLEGVKRLGFSRRRSEFIAAGAILLVEIFDALGIREMEVSGYALGEGVIAEMMITENGSNRELDLGANARWRSVVGLAVRFDVKNRMKATVQCVSIAKDIFYGIRRCGILRSEDNASKLSECLDEKSFEYIEAAILLHNIGLVTGKKGYHKCSYQIIKNGGHLHGYNSREIEVIALLAIFHKKKFPKQEHALLQELTVEMKEKFRALCIIVRLSLSLHQCKVFQGLEVAHSPDGFKLVLKEFKEEFLDPNPCSIPWTSETVKAELKSELQHFEEVQWRHSDLRKSEERYHCGFSHPPLFWHGSSYFIHEAHKHQWINAAMMCCLAGKEI